MGWAWEMDSAALLVLAAWGRVGQESVLMWRPPWGPETTPSLGLCSLETENLQGPDPRVLLHWVCPWMYLG